MAEGKPGEKSIEMRLAEIEDKLAKIHITEEEIKAYQKVSSLLGGGGATVGMEAAVDPNIPALSPTVCTILRQRGVPITRIVPRIVNECTCGPCSQTGGGFTGGFGGFGM